MAEIFGAVASSAGLVSLAIQLGACAVKLTNFYNQVDKAPKLLYDLSKEIETFQLVLLQIERTRKADDTDLLVKCIEACEKHAQEIVHTTNRLEEIIRKYRLAGRAYFVFRHQDVVELFADLERSKENLMLAFTVFERGELLKKLDQQSVMLQKIEEIVTRSCAATPKPKLQLVKSSQEAVTNAESVPSSRAKRGKIQFHGSKTYEFRIPVWFTSRVWHLSVAFSLGQWCANLQTWNLRPEDCEATVYYMAGDARAVADMFRLRKASPCDIYGNWTALELAAHSRSVELCKFLIDFRFPDYKDVFYRACDILEIYFNYSGLLGHRPIVQLFIDNDDFVTEEYLTPTSSRPFANNCHFDENILPAITKQMAVPFEAWSPQARFTFCWQHCATSPTIMTSLQSRFSEHGFETPIERLRTTSGQTVLHLIASRVAYLSSDAECAGFMKRIIHDGADLHAKDGQGRTPLMLLLPGGRRFDYFYGNQNIELLKVWASLLQAAGVELEQYGSREHRLWMSWLSALSANALPSHTRQYLFMYGKDPNDWHASVLRQAVISVWKLKPIAGGWPLSPFIPRRIIWTPSQMDTVEGASWEREQDRDVALHIQQKSCRGRCDDQELVHSSLNLSKASAKDDGELVEMVCHHTRRRYRSVLRQASQPPAMKKNVRIGDLRLQQDRCPSWDHYTCKCDKGERNQRNLYRIMSNLRRWKKFVDEYGFLPRSCFYDSYLFDGVHRTMSAMDIGGYDPYSQPCATFPDCVHQKAYIHSKLHA